MDTHERLSGLGTALAAFLATLACGGAHAAPMVGVTDDNRLARFDTSDIAASPSFTDITGLAEGEHFVAIDQRANHLLYGLTQSSRLYVIDERTGVATFATALASPIVNSTAVYGMDFIYAVGTPEMRLVSNAGQSYGINPDTGAVSLGSALPSGIEGIAYTGFVSSSHPGSTYFVNTVSDRLQSGWGPYFPYAGIGAGTPLGIDVVRVNGFDVGLDNVLYGAFTVNTGGSPSTGIYRVSLASGATLVGTFSGGTLVAMAASTVPEPASWALLATGALLVGRAARGRMRSAG